jgi:hypothetical protein
MVVAEKPWVANSRSAASRIFSAVACDRSMRS